MRKEGLPVFLVVLILSTIMILEMAGEATVKASNDEQSNSIFTGPYGFDKTISREVLENYLSRAVSHDFLLYADYAQFMEDIRMLKNIGAKFIGRAAGVWSMWYDETYWKMVATKIRMGHSQDPEFLFQTCLFETVHKDVSKIPIPEWVFEEFGLTPEERNFSYEAMLYEDGKYRDQWGEGLSVPDMSKPETQMWFFYRAARYIDAGIEAIHFGQVHLMDDNDPDYRHWKSLLTRVRKYASEHARRGFVLCDAHTHGIVVDGELLFDFHSYPMRPKEIEDSPFKTVLEKGHLDSIFGRSKGGITPSGWYAESLPYLVEFDNCGGIIAEPDVYDPYHSVWGYDEISWFARQPEEYRNEWLEYAWNWVRENDSVGYLQFVTNRNLGGYFIELEWEGGVVSTDYYRANQQSDKALNGFSQEETIKRIWAESE